METDFTPLQSRIYIYLYVQLICNRKYGERKRYLGIMVYQCGFFRKSLEKDDAVQG